MNTMTIKALRASIAHWQCMRKDRYCGDNPFSDNCALCEIFLKNEDDEGSPCKGCPVAIKTGRPGCLGTPWLNAVQAFQYEKDAEWRSAAALEIKFLQSLLPAKKKRKQ